MEDSSKNNKSDAKATDKKYIKKAKTNELIIEPPKDYPIQAKIKGPGPAAYSLPTTLGRKSYKLRAPAYSFGLYFDPNQKIVSPSPNKFFPSVCRTGHFKGPSYSLRVKTKEFKNDTIGFPGPGTYDQTCNTIYTKNPSYSIKSRTRPLRPDPNPGPALYSRTTSVKSTPSWSINPKRELKSTVISPGPAAYATTDYNVYLKESPAYSLKKRFQSTEYISVEESLKNKKRTAPVKPRKVVLPSPDSYSVKMGYVTNSSPKFSFRNKHSDYELYVDDNIPI
ncbi:hypothetical protein LY90DRAFT_144037 [Neocallimastix californiae]|jgi:hypothetical protein|uniref:Uncharacterized protein n=1 Tax=Neocallimastix californiae TaxID=1754190 RepID=A0A1Y2ETP3_9FUNG|nr:hypothetical protein LY90DRAFT_144037 [Neocallimastix californiae]|eukprot:ORY74938.1 hypothetical protein LY90DRAFT_144037 [Neocallimastix californiae]